MIFLIDIDGTLLLTGGAGFVALNQTFVDLYGLADAMRGIHPQGKTDPVIVQEAFRVRFERDPTEAELQRVLARYVTLLPDAVAQSPGFRVLAGAAAGLDRLAAQGHALGLATGNVREGARIKLERAGFWSRFGFGGYGDDSADRATLVKRAAERGAAQLGQPLQPSRVVVVGDTPLDVAAARENGFQAIAVASGTVPREALAESAPDRLVQRLDEI